MATNVHHRLMIAFAAVSLMSLVGGRALIPSMGITGAAWALLLIDAVMVSLVLRTTLAQLHESFPEFAAGLLRFPWERTLTGLGEGA
jgi:O-antigen/teichoic acid export membrane protein